MRSTSGSGIRVTETSHKPCIDCGETKPLDKFYNQASTKDGKSPYCKACHNARNKAWQKANPEKMSGFSRRSLLKRKYGITVEQYDEMYERQGGCCAICGTAEGTHVDHDHETGEVRALLCHSCNVGIGHFRDNPELLQAAIEYLEVHNEYKLDAH